MMLEALLSVFVLAATPVQTPSANPLLRQAMERIRAIEEKEGLALLNRAMQWPHNTVEDLAQIQLWQGLAYAGLSEEAKARTHFEGALRLSPTLVLPAQTSPRVQGWWEEARKRVGISPPPLVPAAEPISPLVVVHVEQAPPTPAPPRLRRAVGVGLLAAGVVGLGSALILGLQAQSNHRSAVSEPSLGIATRAQQTAVRQAQTANWFWGLGTAAALSGGALWVF